MSILNAIRNDLIEAFNAASYHDVLAEVSVSRRPELCDFQCNTALRLAGLYKKTPLEIAQSVAEKLKMQRDTVYEVSVQAPGFINIALTGGWFVNYLNQMLKDPYLGSEPVAIPQKIIVDFGGANVAKALHVGHLRSAVIGESIIRLLRFKGHEVIGDIHLGDWGLQMGLVIEMLKSEQPDLPYFQFEEVQTFPSQPPFNIEKLTELYTKANIKSKEDSVFRALAAQATASLQEGHKGYRALWQHMMTVSVADLKKNYGALQVTFDLWLGESDSQSAIPIVIEWLENRELLVVSEGAKVVFVDEETDKKPMPPCIFQKSNGAVLYGATDLATLYQRSKQYQPDEIIYVVDKRQELHFEQISRVAYKSEIVPKHTKISFVGFGTMNGSDGKPFKTRDGGVMALEDLINELIRGAISRLVDTVDDQDKDEIALAVGVGALKFGDLSNLPVRDYVFDLHQFTSFEGKTGPYIQYAMVRIASIKKKIQVDENEIFPITSPVTDVERSLMLKLSMFGAWVDLATSLRQPSKICDYVFELSQTFNQFYHEVHIVSEEDFTKKMSYYALLCLTQKVLKQCLWLLGIQELEKM
ncbi:arginine--tRNA ligase [Fusibacter bizertensis]